MKHMTWIQQHDAVDCGAACLSMVLRFYGKKLPLASIRTAIKTDCYGASIYGLLEGAKIYGLQGVAFEGSCEDVWQAITQKGVALPAILRIVNSHNMEHYIVVSAYKNHKIIIYDPADGKYRLSYQDFSQCFLGQIITFEKGDEFVCQNFRKGYFSRFIRIVAEQKMQFLFIGVLSFFINIIGILGTFIFQFIMDNVLSNIQNDALLDEGIDFFALVIFVLLLLYLFKFAVSILRGKLMTYVAKNIDISLFLDYQSHLLHLPFSFFENYKTGELMSRFQDTAKIRNALSSVTLTLMIDSVLVIICGMILHHQSANLFHISLCLFFIYLLISIFYINPLRKANRKLLGQNAQFDSYLKESIDGIETIKLTHSEATIAEKSNSLFEKLLQYNVRSSMLSVTKDSLLDLVSFIGILIILWVGVLDVINGSLTIGALITFYSMLGYFLTPIENLISLQENIQTAIVAAERLNDILAVKTEENGGNNYEEPFEKLDCSNLSFRYSNREEILHTINFCIKKGEHFALVGESGSGKSTLTKLLARLYTPETGEIKINDIPIQDFTKTALNHSVVYVPQLPFFFSDSIRNNLFLGLSKEQFPSDNELSFVLDTCACEFILELPLAIDSFLEENALNLSGGQKQCLAIARALLQKPQLLLLDESMSAMDSITEHRVLENIHKNFPSMTILTISHRLNSIKNYDKILVLHNGKIVEQGSHASLLEQQGYYTQLWNRQNQ